MSDIDVNRRDQNLKLIDKCACTATYRKSDNNLKERDESHIASVYDNCDITSLHSSKRSNHKKANVKNNINVFTQMSNSNKILKSLLNDRLNESN